MRDEIRPSQSQVMQPAQMSEENDQEMKNDTEEDGSETEQEDDEPEVLMPQPAEVKSVAQPVVPHEIEPEKIQRV